MPGAAGAICVRYPHRSSLRAGAHPRYHGRRGRPHSSGFPRPYGDAGGRKAPGSSSRGRAPLRGAGADGGGNRTDGGLVRKTIAVAIAAGRPILRLLAALSVLWGIFVPSIIFV